MPRRPLLALLALTALAACATPEQRCAGPALTELRTVNGLIAETERSIARGYALRREPDVRHRLLPCRPGDGPFAFCTYDEITMVERPVAIDRAAERAKLATLFERRAELQQTIRARLTACGF